MQGPEQWYIYVCTHTHPPSCYSNSRNYHLSLPRPRMDKFKTSLVFFFFLSFYGTAYLWQSFRSCHLLSFFNPNFVYTLKQLHRLDYKRKLLERGKEFFEWLPLEWLVIWDIDFCPILLTACASDFLCDFFPFPCCCLYEISTDCFCFFPFSNISHMNLSAVLSAVLLPYLLVHV